MASAKGIKKEDEWKWLFKAIGYSIKYMWEFLCWIGRSIKGMFGFAKSRNARRVQKKEQKKKIDGLISRLRNGERLNVHCPQAYCMVELGRCSMLEQCLIKELEKCR